MPATESVSEDAGRHRTFEPAARSQICRDDEKLSRRRHEDHATAGTRRSVALTG